MLFHFCVLYLRIRRKELKIRNYLCHLPSVVNVMFNLSNDDNQTIQDNENKPMIFLSPGVIWKEKIENIFFECTFVGR